MAYKLAGQGQLLNGFPHTPSSFAVQKTVPRIARKQSGTGSSLRRRVFPARKELMLHVEHIERFADCVVDHVI
jgi:hypothetical protein